MMPSKSNFYADAQPSNVNPGPADKPTEPEVKEDGGDDSQTAEIPKAVLGGKDFKPGEEVTLQVMQVMEDSVLVKYASEKGEEEQEEAPPPEAAPEQPANPMYQ